MLCCISPFSGVPVKIMELSRPLLQLILADEAVVSCGWRESAPSSRASKNTMIQIQIRKVSEDKMLMNPLQKCS